MSVCTSLYVILWNSSSSLLWHVSIAAIRASFLWVLGSLFGSGSRCPQVLSSWFRVSLCMCMA